MSSTRLVHVKTVTSDIVGKGLVPFLTWLNYTHRGPTSHIGEGIHYRPRKSRNARKVKCSGADTPRPTAGVIFEVVDLVISGGGA